MSRSIRNAAIAATPMFPSIDQATADAKAVWIAYQQALTSVGKPRRNPVLAHAEKLVWDHITLPALLSTLNR